MFKLYECKDWKNTFYTYMWSINGKLHILNKKYSTYTLKTKQISIHQLWEL